MAQDRTTVLLKTGETTRKLLKVWFGPDGTYYLAAPYHSGRTAVLFKHTVRYDMQFGESREVLQSEFLDDATLDDNEGTIKLAHHPSGLCQFSGRGILSGVDENGRIKGVGVHTRALQAVGDGPAWGFLAFGFADFDQCDTVAACDVVTRFEDLAPAAKAEPPPDADTPLPPKDAIVVEGYYFQPMFRKFVTCDSEGRPVLMRVHPTGMVLKLAVILSPADCGYPGFLGLDFYRKHAFNTDPSGFCLNGPGESIGEDPLGRKVGNVIGCFYPRPEGWEGRRSVNYPPRDASGAPDAGP